MTPGLTCIVCELPLYPAPAERTEYGYKHAADTCPVECAIRSCSKPRRKRAYCETHYAQWKRHGVVVDPSDRLEDLEWMAETGESLIGAAARLGMTVKALEKFLGRHRRTDLRDTLTARNPRDHNHTPDGSRITDITHTPADRLRHQRRIERNRQRRRENAA